MAMADYHEVLIPIVSLAINMIFQVIFYRILTKYGLLKSVFFGFAFGFFSLIFLELGTLSYLSKSSTGFFFVLTANLIIYSSLSYCYFNFITLGETARRVRILRELYDSRKGLTMQELLERYNAKHIIDARIIRLINNDQILYRDGHYYIGRPAVLLIANIIAAFQRMLLGKRSSETEDL